MLNLLRWTCDQAMELSLSATSWPTSVGLYEGLHTFWCMSSLLNQCINQFINKLLSWLIFFWFSFLPLLPLHSFALFHSCCQFPFCLSLLHFLCICFLLCLFDCLFACLFDRIACWALLCLIVHFSFVHLFACFLLVCMFEHGIKTDFIHSDLCALHSPRPLGKAPLHWASPGLWHPRLWKPCADF